MSTDINTSTSNVSTSTLNVPTLSKRVVAIAMFAVLALLMGAKFSGALISGPSSGGHASTSAAYYYGQQSGLTAVDSTTIAVATTSTAPGTITVSWTDPISSGLPITSYTVVDSSGNQTLCTQTGGALGAANSCSWTPTSATKYAGVIHVSVNSTGYPSVLDSGSVALAVLSVPTGTPTAVAGNGYVTVTYVPATSDATATLKPTGYNVYTNDTLVCTAAPSATTCTFTNAAAGLSAGQNYQYSVKAVNAAGNSISSALTTNTLTLAAPAAATNVVAAVNYVKGTVDLTYTAPATNGGASLTATYYVNGSPVACGTAAVTGATCSIAISAFPTSPFTGVVTVKESNGTASSYANSNSFTVNIVPAAVTGAYFTIGSGTTASQLTPSWSASSDTSVIGYNLQLETCTSTIVTVATCTASGSPVFVGGKTTTTASAFTMAGGNTYTYAISAVNAAGASAPALAVYGSGGTAYYTYAVSAPTVPTVTVGSVTNAAITFTFTAPTYNNGSAITGYTYQAYSVDSGALVGSAKSVAAAGTYTISGLSPLSRYYVVVTPLNAAGSGTAGNSSTVSVGTNATSFAVKYTATGVTFSWTAPAASATLNNAEASYNVVVGTATVCTSTTTTCDVAAASIQAAMKLSLTAYVYAVDAAGAQNVASNLVTLAAPGAPTIGTVYTNAAGTSIEVTWTAGSGSAATSYVITSTTSTGVQQTWTAASTATSYVIPAASLTSSLTEKFQVAAVNGAGSGASVASDPASGASIAAAPADPVTNSLTDIASLIAPSINANGNFVSVAWVANPTTVAGNNVTSFTVTLQDASGTGAIYTCTITPAAAAGPSALDAYVKGAVSGGHVYICTFGGVAANASYIYTVTANGPLSSSPGTGTYVTGTAQSASGAGAPTIVSATSSSDGTSVTVVFSPPSTNPATLWEYLVVLDDGAGNLNNGANTTPASSTGKFAPNGTLNNVATCETATITSGVGSCTIDHLYPGITYAVSVYTVDTLGGYTALAPDKAVQLSPAATSTVTTKNKPAQPAAPTVALAASTTSAAKAVVTYTAVDTATSYTITATDIGSYQDQGAISCALASSVTSAQATISSCVVTIVTPGVYPVTVTVSGTHPESTVFYVTATNAVGDSIKSAASAPVTLTYAPAQPVAYYTGTTTTGYTVGWAAVSGATSYTVSVTGGTSMLTYTPTTTNFLIPSADLSAGNTYTITVTASNAGGSSSTTGIAASITAISYASPVITYTASNTYAAGQLVTVTGLTSCTGGNVTNAVIASATSSSFTVSAGTGLTCTTSTATAAAAAIASPVVAVPSQPTSFMELKDAATPTKLTFSWTPAAANNLPVTYVLQGTLNGVVTTIASGITATTYSMAYNSGYSAFTISEASDYGISAATTTPTVITATPAPLAPTVSVGTLTSTTAGITWSLGATDGVSSSSVVPLITYTATLTSSSGAVISCPTSTVSATSCTFAGLTPSTTYTYSVSETTLAGTSTVATGTLQTTGTVPGTPVITALTTADSVIGSATSAGSYYHTVTVTWTAPASTGSSAATGYLVWVTKDSDSSATNAVYCSTVMTGSSTSCTINVGNTGGGVKWYPVVYALNATGASTTPATYKTGTATAYSTGRTTYTTTHSDAAAPAAWALDSSAVTHAVTVNYGDLGTLSVSWLVGGPTDNAAPVTGFTCIATSTGYPTVSVSVAASATSCTLTGLSNVVYNVAVKATNAIGSTYATNATVASPVVTSNWVNNTPVNFAAVSTVGGTVTAAWATPAVVPNSSNASSITSYIVTATDAAGTVFTKTCAAPASLCTVIGVVPGTTYTLVVTSVTAAGNSTVVASNTVTALATANPAAVTAVAAVRTANGLSVSWKAPATLGSAAQLVGYWVTATDALTGQQFTCPYNATYGVLLAPSVSCNIGGLAVGNSYTVSVTPIGVDANLTKLLGTAATLSVTYSSLAPEPVITTFLAVTAKQKSVSALSGAAKSALNNLISAINDGAKVTVTGYGTTKAIALARANAAANYMFNNGAAIHVSVKTVISRTVKTALVTVTSN